MPNPILANKRLPLIAAALLLLFSSPARAEDPLPFELSPGSASAALKQFAKQSELSIVYDPRAVKYVRTNAVVGSLLPKDALDRLLADTPLGYTQDRKTGAFAVFKKELPKTAQPSEAPASPPPPRSPQRPPRRAGSNFDPSDSDRIITLSPFIANADKSIKYQATNTQSATRMNVPLRDVPFNLQVVTSTFMDDTMAYGGAPLEFGGGANREAVSWMGSVEGKSVRGFDTREFLRNGFLRYADNGSATIDRIEIIKGPTSILDGVTSPGGVINVVTKTPNPLYDFTRLKFVYGAPLDRVVANFDVNRRVASRAGGKPLATLRLVGGYERSAYLTAHRQRELENIMPSLLLEFSDKTLLGLQHEYYAVNGERGNGVQGFQTTVPVEAANGLHGEVPIYERYGVDKFASWDGPDFNTPEKVNDTLLSLQHRFTNQFVFNIDYNRHERKTNWNPYTYNRTVVEKDGVPKWNHSWQMIERSQTVNGLRANAALKLDTEKTQHRIVLGYLQQTDSTPIVRKEFFGQDDQLLVSQFPLLDPDPDLSFPHGAAPKTQSALKVDFQARSLYLNHQAKWLDGRLTTLWGIYNASLHSVEAHSNLSDTEPDTNPVDYRITKAMPQAGLIYSISDAVGLYANYSQSMQGNAGLLDGFDNPFKETPGYIYEIGSKFELSEQKLNGTVSLFKIVETNRIVFDPDAPSKENLTSNLNLLPGANVSIGELTSTGFDADLFYNPVENFNIVLSYGYKNLEITQDPDQSKVGQSANGFKHKAGLFNKYTWTEGPLDGASMNLGVIWRSKYQRSPDRFGQPSYADSQYNLQFGVGYQFEIGEIDYKLNLAAKNLFQLNRRWNGYQPGTRDPYYLANPAEYLASLDLEF